MVEQSQSPLAGDRALWSNPFVPSAPLLPTLASHKHNSTAACLLKATAANSFIQSYFLCLIYLRRGTDERGAVLAPVTVSCYITGISARVEKKSLIIHIVLG